MEFLLDSVLFSVILGLGATVITEASKKFKLPPKYVVLGVAIVLSLVYILVQKVAPAEVLEQFVSTGLEVLASAVLIYEFVITKLPKKK